MTYSPVISEGLDRAGPWLVTCDHATNVVPDFVADGNLGVPAEDMARHIAYDIGALGVARKLGALLAAPVLAANFSRLVIDPNRGADDPTLIPQLYDGTIISANRRLGPTNKAARFDRLYRPYHAAIAQMAQRRDVIFVSIHSFTPQLKGKAPRPWEVGVLSAKDRRMADPLIASLTRALSSPVGDNAPYAGFFPGDALSQHAHETGRPNVLLEIRQDLISGGDGQTAWAHLLARHLEEGRKNADLFEHARQDQSAPRAGPAP